MIVKPAPLPRVSGLRPGTPDLSAPAGGAFSTPPGVIEAEVGALAAAYPLLGVPLDADTPEARAMEVIDPDVIKAQASAVDALECGAAAAVVQDSGVSAAALRARTAQAQHLVRINSLSADAEVRAQDGQRVMARVQRELRAALCAAVQEALQGAEVPAEERGALDAFLHQIQMAEEQTRSERQAQAHKTRVKSAVDQAQRDAQTQREQALHTVVNLKAGGTATPAEIQAAYDALSAPGQGLR